MRRLKCSKIPASSRSFEIIVVDDGSDDDTAKKLTGRFELLQIETVDNHCVLQHKEWLVESVVQRHKYCCSWRQSITANWFIGFFHQKGFRLRKALQGYQELEYGIAFCIVRPIFDRIGTSMLISGALGLFNKDVVIRLGGYALDTVGEDMELVMRIRQFSAESNKLFEIRYAVNAVCFTELPWIEIDLRKQRIRWTVGLTDVL